MLSLLKNLSKTQENLIICSNKLNETLFKASLSDNYLYDIKFKTIKEFEDDILGYYDHSAIKFLHDSQNITYDAAREILKTYLLVDSSDKEKVSDFYIYDKTLINNYLDKNILVFTPFSFDNLFHKSRNILESQNINIHYIDLDEIKEEELNHTCIEFKTDVEEIEHLAEKISDLINKGIEPGKIKIQFNDNTYISLINDVFSFYQIPYNLPEKTPLYSIDVVIKLVNYLKSNNLPIKSESIELFKNDNYISEEVDKAIRKVLMTYKINDIDYFRYVLSSIYMPKKKYKNLVEFDDFFDSFISNDEHYFIIGANEKTFPAIYKESGLLTEETLKKEGLKLGQEINEYRANYIKKRIARTKNVHISYRLKDVKKDYSRSNLLDDIPSLKEETNIKGEFRYSIERDKFNLCKGLDIYEKYHNKTNYYKKNISLRKEIDSIRRNYSSTMNFNDKISYLDRINNSLNLSISKINTYYTCPYRYYLDSVVRVNSYEVSLKTYIGNFFHEYINKRIDEDFDETVLRLDYEEYRDRVFEESGFKLSCDEEFFFKQFYDNLKNIQPLIHMQNELCGFETALHERELKCVENHNGISVNINGRADLIRIDEEGYAAIIDYKTGNIYKIDIENGLNMQLYLYLSLLLKERDDIKPFGLFYHHISRNELDKETKNILEGSYIDLPDLKQKMDPNGIYIKSGKGSLIDEDTIFNNLTIVENKVEEAIERILKLDFKQNQSTESCRSCSYGEICYKKNFKQEEEYNGENGSD